MGDGLFSSWRYNPDGSPKPDFPLNKPAYQNGKILIAGRNFGSGSSREHAVWALAEYGFRVVIAPSFNPIFYGNCVNNGIVPAIVKDGVQALFAADAREEPPKILTVDLLRRVIVSSEAEYEFEIHDDARESLIHGLDPIARTLALDGTIQTFIEDDIVLRPWIYASPEGR